MVGAVGFVGAITVGAAAAAALTAPISITLPAARPPWSTTSLTRSAVTLAVAVRGGFCVVSTWEPSTSRVPQSASGTTRFGDGVISCPSTVRPVIEDPETLPEALTVPAATLTRRSSEATVISPPKSETASAPVFACALEDVPGCATTCASAEPIFTTVPSSG